jgi:hypothetical protein
MRAAPRVMPVDGNRLWFFLGGIAIGIVVAYLLSLVLPLAFAVVLGIAVGAFIAFAATNRK